MSICLNMIVRDEAGIIAETLRTLCAGISIDYWVICDTGSTDGTQDIVRATFADLGIPGELHEAPWVNFAHNRNIALDLCRGKAEFVLFFDADDLLLGAPDISRLEADAWNMRMESENRRLRYSRKLLVRNDGRARWRGVVHEFLDTGDMRIADLGGEHAVISRRKGARSQDPGKYRKDALLLEKGFSDPGDEDLKPRYAYYCANSWRDFGDRDKALEWYERRMTLGGWSEERFLAHMEAALICERHGDTALALQRLLEGHDLVPDRAECLYHASRILRYQAKFHSALIFAKEGVSLAKPTGNRLFLNNAIYDYWLDYELLFLTARTGGAPKLSPHYARFLASNAPEKEKRAIAAL